jgi:nicotinamide-nucleotide amidase
MQGKKAVRIEIIATGDELLYGRILDTNSNWLAKRIVELGGQLHRVTIVGDNKDEIGETLKEALSRENDIIIFTGGLGPSLDDLTVESIGATIKRNIIYDPTTVEKIKTVYRKRGIEDTSRGERMARILAGTEAIQNNVGFSVGMILQEQNRLIFTFPGVPEEMKKMFNSSVAEIIEKGSLNRSHAKTIIVKMIWKDFFPLFWNLQTDFPEIYMKNAATPPMEEYEREKIHEIKVDIVVKGLTKEEAENRMGVFLKEYQGRINQAGGGEILPVNNYADE